MGSTLKEREKMEIQVKPIEEEPAPGTWAHIIWEREQGIGEFPEDGE